MKSSDSFVVGIARRKPSKVEEDSEGEDSSESSDNYSGVVDDAVSEIADILGVEKGDRKRLGRALEDICRACCDRAMSEEE